MREHVVEHRHDEVAVLVVDETGDVKRGIRTVVLLLGVLLTAATPRPGGSPSSRAGGPSSAPSAGS